MDGLLSSDTNSGPATCPPQARAWELLAQASESGAHLVEVTGGPWSGKTRFLRAFQEHLSQRGWLAVTSSANPNADMPYQAFVDGLDDYLGRVRPELAERLGPCLATLLSTVFPSMTGIQCGIPDGCHALSSRMSAAQERYLAFQAVGVGLLVIAQSRPVSLVIDDGQHLDEASLALLGHLLAHPPNLRLMITVAYRPRQAGLGLATLMEDARRRSSTWQVPIEPFNARELRALLPKGTNEVEARAMVRIARGNPGVLLALASARAPHPDVEFCGVRDTREFVDGTPPLMVAAGFAEFVALSQTGRLVARAASVAGDPFELSSLGAIAEVDDHEVLTGLGELLDRDIVRPCPASGWFGFRDVVIRSMVYHSAHEAWRYAAHQRATSALKRVSAPAAQLAAHVEHISATDDVEKAQILVMAARNCVFPMPMRTVRWLRALFRIQPAQRRKPEIMALLGQSLAVTGHFAEGESVLRALREDTELTGSPVRADVAEWLARVLRLTSRPVEASTVLRSAIDELVGSDADPAALELELSTLSAESEQFGPAVGLRPVLLAVTKHSERVLRVRARSLLALIEAEEPQAALRHIAEADSMLRDLDEDDRARTLDSRYWLGEAHRRMGRFQEAIVQFDHGIDDAELFGHDYLRPRLAAGLTRSLAAGGDMAEAVTWARYARDANRMVADRFEPPRLDGTPVARRDELPDDVTAIADSTEHPVPDLTHSVPEQRRSTNCHVPDQQVPDPQASLVGSLSRRELEIAYLVSKGYTNQRIARSLKLSHKTVETYLDRTFKKLGVASRAELAFQVGSVSTRPALLCQPSPGEDR